MSDVTSKNGWTRVAFGDVVRQVRDIVDPDESDLERYVAGEHMDTDDLRIRRWGTIGAGYLGPAFHMRFKPGHVLYGSRRTYLRKVAVPDFEGITANTTFVIEAKDPKVLLPELLPFIMQTESFHEHSIKQSKGSVNPYVNFSDLTWYEFALPPLEEQRKISNVLRTVSNAANVYDKSASSAEITSVSMLMQYIQGAHIGDLTYDERFGRYSSTLPLTPIGELLTKTQYGLSEPSTSGGRYKMLRMMDLSDGLATDQDRCCLDLSDSDFHRYQLEDGDLLFNRTNSHDLVGRTGIYKLNGEHVFASYLIRVKTNTSRLLPEYLCAFLNAPLGRRQIMRFATRGVSQTNVNVSNLRRVLIPLPPIDYQQAVIEYLESLREGHRALRRRASEARQLGAQMANEFIGMGT